MTSEYEDGNPNASICLVGEAPSNYELLERRPFVGPAGKLLQNCLHAAGIARADCYIVNVFERMVRKNDTTGEISDRQGTPLWHPKRGFTDAGKEASKGCLERLRACHANVIVPLGGVANSLLTGTSEIMKWRGSIVKNVLGRKTVATLHPSGALRGSYVWRYLIAADFGRVWSEATFPGILLPKRDIRMRPTLDDVRIAFDMCRRAKRFATDIEVLSSQVSCFSLSTDPSWAISIPLVDSDWQHYWTPEQEAEIWLQYAQLIADPSIEKVNQNITFDLSVLLQRNKIVPQGRLADPMIAHSLMNPFLSKSLGTLCSLYTREPYYKDDGDIHNSSKVADWDRYWAYNAKDACIALECMNVLAPLVEKDGLQNTYDRTIALLPVLIEMMSRGFKVNVEALAQTRVEVEKRIEALVEEMTGTFGRRIITEAPKTAKAKREAAGALNVNSPAQLKEFFYASRKIKPYTRDGKATTDDKALAQLYRTHGLVEAKQLQDYRSLAKLLGTYLEVEYDRDHRMRCSYNPRGTWTGRLSSSQTVFGTGMNMQNLHSDFRGFLESDP